MAWSSKLFSSLVSNSHSGHSWVFTVWHLIIVYKKRLNAPLPSSLVKGLVTSCDCIPPSCLILELQTGHALEWSFWIRHRVELLQSLACHKFYKQKFFTFYILDSKVNFFRFFFPFDYDRLKVLNFSKLEVWRHRSQYVG